MSNRWRWASVIVVACALLASQPMAAGAQSGADDGWELPRTAWGDPDLQGVWTSATLTPLERPAGQAGRELLTDEEAAAIEQRTVGEPGRQRRQVGPRDRRRLQPGVAGCGDAHHRRPAHLACRRPARRPHPLAAGRARGPRPRAGALRSRSVPLLHRRRHRRALHHRRAAEHGAAAALQHEPAGPADPGAGGDAARDVPRAAGHSPGRPAADRHPRSGRARRGAGGRATPSSSRPSTWSTSPTRTGALRGASRAPPCGWSSGSPGSAPSRSTTRSRWRIRRSSSGRGPRRRP